jgi:iron complex transport system ATP-binding protein
MKDKTARGRPAVSFENISFRYDSCQNCRCSNIINDLSFNLNEGRSVAILGANGAGKSTLLLLMAAYLKPSAGKIFINGEDISLHSTAERSSLISYCAQNIEAAFNFSAYEIIALGRAPHLNYFGALGEKDRVIIEKASAALELEPLLDRPFNLLSGGERKRVMLARAIAQDAPIAIFDEPEAHLDIRHQMQFFNYINSAVSEHKKLCIFSVHNPELAVKYSSEAILFYETRGCAISGPTNEIVNESNLKRIYGIDFERAVTASGRTIIIPEACK